MFKGGAYFLLESEGMFESLFRGVSAKQLEGYGLQAFIWWMERIAVTGWAERKAPSRRKGLS